MIACTDDGSGDSAGSTFGLEVGEESDSQTLDSGTSGDEVGDTGTTDTGTADTGTTDTDTGTTDTGTTDTDTDTGGATCGNGEVEDGEECDDGGESGACDIDCTLAECGDAVVNMAAGEACDDGNDIDDDECSNSCSLASCGDGVLNDGEQCDDGNDDDTDACPSSCMNAVCGDSFVLADVEECDAGGESDSCDADCSLATCGDGTLNMSAGEVCDDGNDDDTDACPGCAAATCGDGFVQTDVEECDDGNDVDDDACANDCTDNGCQPLGQRAPLDTLSLNNASGCWDGNPCQFDQYLWNNSHGQNFQAFGQGISCTGASTCVENVGITTYQSESVCQGMWDVYCDGEILGTIDTLNTSCVGSAQGNGCNISFPARQCAAIEIVAADDGDATLGCCGSNQPDSMVTSISAW